MRTEQAAGKERRVAGTRTRRKNARKTRAQRPFGNRELVVLKACLSWNKAWWSLSFLLPADRSEGGEGCSPSRVPESASEMRTRSSFPAPLLGSGVPGLSLSRSVASSLVSGSQLAILKLITYFQRLCLLIIGCYLNFR